MPLISVHGIRSARPKVASTGRFGPTEGVVGATPDSRGVEFSGGSTHLHPANQLGKNPVGCGIDSLRQRRPLPAGSVVRSGKDAVFSPASVMGASSCE